MRARLRMRHDASGYTGCQLTYMRAGKDCDFANNYALSQTKKNKKTILLPEHTKVPAPDYL